MRNTDLLQETFNLLDKRYGINKIRRVDELPQTKDSIVSTGIIGLDMALGVGGIKRAVSLRFMLPKVQVRLHLPYRYANSTRNRASQCCT